jgi:S-adenosylmethionine-diacylgycerolhomoserine-N-methlytransferase
MSGEHGALMDSVYRHQRFIYDLTRKYYLFGRDRMIRELELRPGERLVEIGCGTARNLIAIARRYPDARLYGLDASQEMLKTAAGKIHRAGLEGRIRLAHGYAEALTPALFGEEAPFDRALFSYSLSMIPDWKQALKAASSGLEQAGRLHVVDFGDLFGLVWPLRPLLLAWLKLFHVAPRSELLRHFEGSGTKNLYLLPGRYAFLLTAGREFFQT